MAERLPQELRQQVCERVEALVAQARELQGCEGLPMPRVAFDVKGTTAGYAEPGRVRFNPVLLRENTEEFMAQTVPHEVAHLVVRYRWVRARAHGREWKAVMRFFGADPRRCHEYDVTNARTRRLRRFRYCCACGNHEVTSIIHARVQKGKRYICRLCRSPLRYAGEGRTQ